MEEEQKFYTIILRHDTSTNWLIQNPILALGEYGVEDDTHRMKRGNGQTDWDGLPYEHFGLEAMLLFADILGEPEDNAKLKQALVEKINTSAFNSTASNTVSSINLLAGTEDNEIAQIKKTITNVTSGNDTVSLIRIKSSNNSILGSVIPQPDGSIMLDLKGTSGIEAYLQGTFYLKDSFVFLTKSDNTTTIAKATKNFTSDDIEVTIQQSFNKDINNGNLSITSNPNEWIAI